MIRLMTPFNYVVMWCKKVVRMSVPDGTDENHGTHPVSLTVLWDFRRQLGHRILTTARTTGLQTPLWPEEVSLHRVRHCLDRGASRHDVPGVLSVVVFSFAPIAIMGL